MSEPLMQQIDRYNNWKDYEVTITYTVYVEAHSEGEAESFARDELSDYAANETPDIDVTRIN